MRIILKKGKQRELINLAKEKYTWEELSKKINHCSGYLRNELRNEKWSLSDESYAILCNLLDVNFDNFILQKIDDNWGRIKGGTSSSGNTKNFIEPAESEELAELFGIILGDGHVEELKIGKKIRCYAVIIAGDSRHDKEYLENYVSSLFSKLFSENGKIGYSKFRNSIFLRIHGKRIVEFIKKKGVRPGNKKTNNQSIPNWILNNIKYLKACLRGLIDTDGGIYYISKKTNRNLRITYTSYIPALMKAVRDSFIKLGFNPSKIMRERDIYLTSKEDVDKFIREIGFSNNRHLVRIKKLSC